MASLETLIEERMLTAQEATTQHAGLEIALAVLNVAQRYGAERINGIPVRELLAKELGLASPDRIGPQTRVKESFLPLARQAVERAARVEQGIARSAVKLIHKMESDPKRYDHQDIAE